MGTEGLSRFETRCAFKLTYAARDEPAEDCINIFKALFKQIKRVTDNMIAILLSLDQEDEVESIVFQSILP